MDEQVKTLKAVLKYCESLIGKVPADGWDAIAQLEAMVGANSEGESAELVEDLDEILADAEEKLALPAVESVEKKGKK